jgi:hypothetical protein
MNPDAFQTIKTTPLCKETLPPIVWAAGKIEATPHGVFSKMMDKPKNEASQHSLEHSLLRNRSNVSTLVLDDFNILHGKAVVDAEMPRGKRIFPILN